MFNNFYNYITGLKNNRLAYQDAPKKVPEAIQTSETLKSPESGINVDDAIAMVDKMSRFSQLSRGVREYARAYIYDGDKDALKDFAEALARDIDNLKTDLLLAKNERQKSFHMLEFRIAYKLGKDVDLENAKSIDIANNVVASNFNDKVLFTDEDRAYVGKACKDRIAIPWLDEEKPEA